MTQHNFREHLAWLLKSRAHRPPPVDLPSPAIDVHADPRTPNAIEDLADVDDADLLQLSASLDSSLTTTDDPTVVEGQSYPPIPAPVSTARAVADSVEPSASNAMGKLQSGSSSASKPRLISQRPRQAPLTPAASKSTPVSASFSDSYNAQCRKNEQSPRSTIKRPHLPAAACPRTPTADPPTPLPGFTLSRQVAPHVASIDLTEAKCERPRQNPSRAGLKRKSDERADDSASEADASKPLRPRKRDGSYVAVDSYPDEPPPPYFPDRVPIQALDKFDALVTTQLPRSPVFLESDLSCEEEEHTLTETRIVTQTRKRKSVGKPLSTLPKHGPPDPRPARPPPRRPPSPVSATREIPTDPRPETVAPEGIDTPVSKIPTSIAPSQPVEAVDDAGDESDWSGMESLIYDRPPSPDDIDVRSAVEDTPTGADRQSVTRTDVVARVSSPSKVAGDRFVGGDGDASPQRPHPPPERPAADRVPEPAVATGTTAPVPRASTSSTQLVRRFSHMPPPVAQESLRHLEDCLRANERRVVQCIDADEPIPPSLREERKRVKALVADWEALQDARDRHGLIMEAKEKLKRQILDALDDGADTADFEAENSRLVQESQGLMEDMALRLDDMLASPHAPPPLRRYLDDEGEEETPSRTISEVMVRSTQGQPLSRSSAYSGPAMPMTQLVRQTQAHTTSDKRPSPLDIGQARAATEDGYDSGDDDDDAEMFQMVDELETSFRSEAAPAQHRRGFAEASDDVPTHARARTVQASRPAPAAVPSSSPNAQLQLPWSREVKTAMKERFHLRGFRPNQLEAINATLSGKDAFVLMPTGGGKSLCYQLPAVVGGGRTRGVTVVVSPLLSLMQDQVEHLRALDIQAFLLNGEVGAEQRRLVMDGLEAPAVERLIQLLYVTPEMITKNLGLVRTLQRLHQRGKFARIVIDEAHCVSQWGHDFRPDYKALGGFRRQFDGVPVMALTATATENVKVDVIYNLDIAGCAVFSQSFNRPNLSYEVRAKGKAAEVLESIADTIQASYAGQSGIVYCLSRADCERVAQALVQEHGIAAYHYHAGMEAAQKAQVQRDWQAGRYQVMVATIAFGMGIDKADVRFVVHHTLPKSLEGYYQETGRAGRDGKRSGCYLYYGYRDTSALQRFINEGEGSDEQKERSRQMLRSMVSFCEERSECRRVLMLRYFSEPFRRDECGNTCDNCRSDSVYESHDFSEQARAALQLVGRLRGEHVTVLQCADLFRGFRPRNKAFKTDPAGLAEFGAGSGLGRQEAERLFYRLVSEQALEELNKVNKAGFANQTVQVGPNARDFLFGGRKLKIQVRVSPRKPRKAAETAPKRRKGGATAAAPQVDPGSTNVSSPVPQAVRRRAARRAPVVPVADDSVVADDEAIEERSDDGQDDDLLESSSSDGFESIRGAGRTRRRGRASIGPPITVDEKMGRLNEIHRAVVEDFVGQAKGLGEKIRSDRNLRAQPFTDTIYREMAINFPRDEKELLEIGGINAERVRLYGKAFLRLIKRAQTEYESMMQAHEDRDQDPNHTVVISISSDEEDASGAEAVEDLAGLDDLDGPGSQEQRPGSQEQRSQYFGPAADVSAFNAQFSQAAPAVRPSSRAATTRAPMATSQSRGGSRRGGRSFRGGGFRKTSRKGSGGFAKYKGDGRVSKRKTDGRASGGGGSGGVGGSRARSVGSASTSRAQDGGGTGRGSGIKAMPL